MSFDTFDQTRMHALKDYAALEYELCRLLMEVMQVDAPIASAVFYQISNTRTRYAIIGSILDIKHRDTFAKAWERLERWLGPRDTARNHIVHWGQDFLTMVIPTGDDTAPTVHLSPYLSNNVRKWRASANSGLKYSEEDIRDEAFSVRVMTHIINRYWNTIAEPEHWPWTDIFQSPITDQTPELFLQRLNDAGYSVLA